MASAAFLITCLLLFVAALKADDEFQKDGEVLILTDANFDKATERFKNLMVVFYLPNCLNYANMKSDYQQAAKKLAAEGSSIKLAKLEYVYPWTVAARYRLHISPELRFFKNKQISEYHGKRDTESFISFVKAQAS